MAELERTHTIEGITAAPVGQAATLMGWVHYRRDFGQLVFITLRDRWGELQCVFDPEVSGAAHQVAEGLRAEDVVAFTGKTRPRPDKEVRDYPGGDREFIVDSAEVLNAAQTPPFVVEEEVKASEEMRLKYRYLDLRRRAMVRMLTVRHQAVTAIRTYLNSQGFLEIETPLLGRGTPEGARDYVVPSRVHPGQFYALPQSPQLYKQILMCSGVDKYYQIPRCLRDEDLRGNRQPEHTQLDLEMSFATRDQLFTIGEGVMAAVWRDCLGVELETPFVRLSYNETMRRFGTDKPDMRFGCEIVELTDHWQGTEAKFIAAGLEQGQQVHGVFVPKASLSRKQADEWTQTAQNLGAGGLMTLELAGELKGGAAKFVPDPAPFFKKAEAEAGTWFMILGDEAENLRILGQLRLKLGEAFGLIDRDRWAWAWIVDFPLYDPDEETGGITACHHPFTLPIPEDIAKLESEDPEVLLSIRADNYDLVLNGEELASGSHRIHKPELQVLVLRRMGLSDEQIEHRFGWFLEAFKYGAPPHRGFAPGIDRIVMKLLGVDNIREVIAFPKTATATCPLTGAPAAIEDAQWDELGLKPLK